MASWFEKSSSAGASNAACISRRSACEPNIAETMALVSFATRGPGSSHRTIGRRRKPSSTGESDRGRSGHPCTRGTSVGTGAGDAARHYLPPPPGWRDIAGPFGCNRPGGTRGRRKRSLAPRPALPRTQLGPPDRHPDPAPAPAAVSPPAAPQALVLRLVLEPRAAPLRGPGRGRPLGPAVLGGVGPPGTPAHQT